MDRRSFLIGVAAGLFILNLPGFFHHLEYFLSGQVEKAVIQQNWKFVALNALGFLLFLIPLRYRRKTDWRAYGIYTAFIVSLFVEMYGIPLSIYLSSGLLGSAVTPPDVLVSFSLLGQNFAMNAWMLTGAAVTATGMAIVAAGWYQIYTAEGLVRDGIYRFSRHPQYLGIIMIAIGWFIGWPTLLTLVILPILCYEYYRLSLEEEEEMIDEFEKERYQQYRDNTPLLI